MAENGTRDDRGRFLDGHRGGPGRKPNGVAAALRRLVDPDAIAAYVYGVAIDPEAPPKDRQWACEFITDRIEGKPVAAIALSAQVATSHALPENWATLTVLERERILGTHPGRNAGTCRAAGRWRLVRYVDREQRALLDLATQTILDPRAQPTDVAAARRRLLTADRVRDFTRLTEPEVATFRALVRKLDGGQFDEVGLRVVAIDATAYVPPCSRCSCLRPEELRELDAWISSPERDRYVDEADDETEGHETAETTHPESGRDQLAGSPRPHAV
jgi:hypothetical protein